MRITESKLRQLIRETLLIESKLTPQQLLGTGLKVRVGYRNGVLFISCDDGVISTNPSTRFGSLWVSPPSVRQGDRPGDGPCLGAWEVVRAEVEGVHGLGPLLYDVAMELSGKHGLMSDRNSVSVYALDVWDFYLSKRSDVEVIQLDSLKDDLTPGFPDDNCSQKPARKYKKSGWPKSSLSKAYRVKGGGTPTIDELKRLGLIEFK